LLLHLLLRMLVLDLAKQRLPVPVLAPELWPLAALASATGQPGVRELVQPKQAVAERVLVSGQGQGQAVTPWATHQLRCP